MSIQVNEFSQTAYMGHDLYFQIENTLAAPQESLLCLHYLCATLTAHPPAYFWQKELFLHVFVDSFSLKVLRIDFFLLNQAVGTWKKSAPLSNFLCVFFRSNLYFKNISLHIFFLLLSLFIPSNLRMSYGKRHGTLGHQS